MYAAHQRVMYLIPALKPCCKLVGIWWYLSIKLLAINRFDHCSVWYRVLVGELRLSEATRLSSMVSVSAARATVSG